MSAPAKSSDLRTRLATAIVLAVLILGALSFKSGVVWALLVSVFCLAAAWEAGRLTKLSPNLQIVLFALVAACILALAALLRSTSVNVAALTVFLMIASVFWVVLAPLELLKRPITTTPVVTLIRMPVLIGAAWLSAVSLERVGTAFLIAVVMITVAADVGGYFLGRAFGKVKLAPSISPGKTREGAMGGVLAAALWTLGAAAVLRVADTAGELAVAAAVGAMLGVLAVIGDLWESQLKRQSGMKDSSQLLPGHGGVLDRIDAHLAVLPVATLILSIVRPMW